MAPLSTTTTAINATITTIYQMDAITQLSLYKLYQQENAHEEPVLRKKVLIRNTLLTACMITMEQEKQKEQCWLDACFDQLDEDMEDSTLDTPLIDPMASPSSSVPPPPPLPPSSPFLFPSQVPPAKDTSHTLLLAIPSEHDKFLALLDWSWPSNTLLSSPPS